ncbi:hypothetical protein [Aquisalinus flavus]|uniref:Uncharacterized protein n=1 Tax=Aquisalinus flavus TaxID=1526572 RepID=A0A8J2V616_9PROT|nr:hypothetical protein [Aquisalinus flavus]MBD0427219.1 hypothetical protein [Aquisalinus flavus]UNE47034.1 hypothetical protein FF099_02660 [Aquisalinus flavus]GGC99280.1 hypothetical protein GCM10011342_05330 [Aquisalinus flavus]
MFNKILESLFPAIPTFDEFADEVILTAMKGAPLLALKKLDLFKRRALNADGHDKGTTGRVYLLEAILNAINSGKYGVSEPLLLAKSAFNSEGADYSIENDVIRELELFLEEDWEGPLVSGDTKTGKWLLSFKSKR